MLTGAQIPVSYSIETKPGISNREKKRMEAWLGKDLKFLK
jgi:hypothetical protein